MKCFPFIFCLFFMLSSFLCAQDDIENEYAYGTITSITDKEIVLKEYNYEKEEFVEISYQLLPETKVRNTDSLKSITNGNQIEILYQEVDTKKNALVVVLETEEGVVEVDNPEKTLKDAVLPSALPAEQGNASAATPTTTTDQSAASTPESPAAVTTPQNVVQTPLPSPETAVPATGNTPAPVENSTASVAAPAPETSPAGPPQSTETAPAANSVEEALPQAPANN